MEWQVQGGIDGVKMKRGRERSFFFNNVGGVCKAGSCDLPVTDNDCRSDSLLALSEVTGRLEIGALVTRK